MRTTGAVDYLCYCMLTLQLLTQPAAKQVLRYRLAEEGPADVRIGNVAADLGIVAGSGEVTFTLESGSDYFKIDNITGELSTNERRIDREKLQQCQMIFDENECFIDFEVSVIGPAQSWVDLFEGKVIILDINDNTPSFPSPVLTLSVEENRPIGTLYLLPTATDRDFGRNGIERYELLQDGGESAGRRTGSGSGGRADAGDAYSGKRRFDAEGASRSSVFELQVADTTDGEKQPQLIIKGALDREQRDSYELTLRVRDGGDPPRSSQAILRVMITDVNDNSPRFEKSFYEADLAENSSPGAPILQLKAADSDVGVNGQIEYVFGAATESVRRLLRLDESSGWLSVLHRIDREEVSQMRFIVMARDRGQPPKMDKATVLLTIKDENDNVPIIDIRKIGRIFLKDGVANVAEDVVVDTPIALVQVSDRDQGENGVVTCTVVGDMPFQLKPASEIEGEQNKKKYFLHTSAPLDYEATQEYNVVIVAVDSGSPSLSSNNSLIVKVGDTNDNPPIFSQNVVEVSFPENNAPQETVATVVALDADSGKNAEIAYSLDSSVNGIFSINPDSGDISVNTVLDREQMERYEFKVIAKDKGIPVLQGSATVVVLVADKNDNEPKFMQDVFTFYVKENLQPNSPVGMVTVIDADKGQNAEMSLFIEEEEDIFSIENDTGTIFSTMSFDREQKTTYTFRVKAVDGGDPPRSATATVSLYVMDENDNPPSVTFPSNSSYTLLPPSSNVRTVVRTVQATDTDTGINADLNYSIVGGNPFKLFEIDTANGVISLVGKVEQKHYGLHRLVVQVNDSGTPSQCTTTLVHIYINETLSNSTIVEGQIARSLGMPLSVDIAGDPNYDLGKQRLSIVIGVVSGIMTVILIILVVVMARYCRPKNKNGYEAGKKDHEDFFTPQQHDKNKKPKKDKKNKKSKQPLYSSIVTVEASKPNGQRYDGVNEKLSDSPGMGRYRSVNGGPGSPDLARHYKSSSPLPTVQLHPQSPTAGKKHQAVQDLPPANTFVGTGDNISIGSDHCSEYSCQTTNKYNKQPFRRVTFSVVSQPQDPHQGSLQSCYDSGLEESETPSSKSSSGPRLGALPLPEDNYERTTPDGSVGEGEHMENDSRPLPDVAMTGKCTRECDEYGHSDSCWMPVRTSPERRQKNNQPKLSTFMPGGAEHGSQETLANGDPAHMVGDRNRNLLNKKMSSSSYDTFSTASFGKNEDGHAEDIPLAQTGEYKPTPCGTLTRREVYL
ncbi:protocadherin-7b isoform X1 [Megalops cyprinoides]|uniref:protocadherin-7b isoform X1 n=1 Tax=Megalops cyprinoides TaxID=118141 RepID=UPI0018651D86|nr:protocadherin-7b isoform X1 [Megalops cyprinoides]XP_036407161.1 protocadherin-7b isoform X1 [Megalops cyprinoides]